jgi:CheY-like chemotaxis protein
MNGMPVLLLAEDDEDDQMLFKEALASIHQGIVCIVANNGKEALRLLQQDIFAKPDYIFLDLNMPVMDGLACLESIKNDMVLKHIPVIIYSTTITDLLLAQTKKLGVYITIKKPDNIDYLKDFLRRLLDL